MRGAGAPIGRGGATALLVMALAAGLPAMLVNGGSRVPIAAPEQALAAEGEVCTGEPMPRPDRVVEGTFSESQEGAYVLIPFRVPAGMEGIRIKYCHDQPQANSVPTLGTLNRHTLDIGVYGPRVGRDGLWDTEEFRGWGGSSRKDVTLSPEATIDPDPAPVATDKTTVGFRPGPIPRGRWAVELGVAALGTELPGEDGAVAWRVEIDLIDDPQFADEPYRPARYRTRPADRDPGWYEGDMHVHARNSNPNDAPMRETFSYAFCPDPRLGELCEAPDAQPGAGLDFITLSDYVSDRTWGEIGAFQRDYPGKLIVRSTEVITYRGHINNHASLRYVDYRAGPVYLRHADGSLELLRGANANTPAQIFRRIHAAGGWTQINHPETFPSEIPGFANLCRGCSWEYSGAQTDYSQVDAIEVATGPGGLLELNVPPEINPFTPLSLQFYEDGIDAGGQNRNHIAAVGSSDSHQAGRPNDPVTQSPIGEATTVVRAPELSEEGIRRGVTAGHTYVKVWGNDGPDLRMRAVAPGSESSPRTFGDTIRADSVHFTARVFSLDRATAVRPGMYALLVMRNGHLASFNAIPAGEDEFVHEFESTGPGRYGLRVVRLTAGVGFEAVSTPIWVERGRKGAGR